MALISRSTLASMQRMSESMMDSEASVQQPGTWVDAGGGAGTQLPGTVVTFKCRRMPAGRGEEVVVAQQPEVMQTEILVYPLDENLSGVAELTVDGVLYSVIGVEPAGTYAVDRRALIQRVNRGTAP